MDRPLSHKNDQTVNSLLGSLTPFPPLCLFKQIHVCLTSLVGTHLSSKHVKLPACVCREQSESKAMFQRKAHRIPSCAISSTGVKRVQKNRPAISEPYDQGSDRQLTFSCTVWSRRCLPKFNSYSYYLISQRAWLEVCHTCWRKTAKFPSCSQNLTSIRYCVQISHTDWTKKKKKQRWQGKKNTASACSLPQKQISTQGYRPDYVDYFLISASVSCVDLGYCCRSNKHS